MYESPAHKLWPSHKIAEHPIKEKLSVEVNGVRLAESSDVIRVDEDGSPPRYYFPRSDVRTDKLERSTTTSECPLKGTAHYFNLNLGGEMVEDAAWSYEEPNDDHRVLKDRLAFYDHKPLKIRLGPDRHAKPKGLFKFSRPRHR